MMLLDRKLTIRYFRSKSRVGSLAILGKVVGSEHPNTNRARSNFAELLLATGAQTEALALHSWKESARVTADVLDALGPHRGGEGGAAAVWAHGTREAKHS